MAYDKINWENSPSTATPISATNLGIMDTGIYTNETNIGTNTTNIGTNTTALGGYSLWSGTLTEYNAITTKDGNTFYFIEEV